MKALLYLATTGASWVIVGAAVGRIGKRGLSLPLYQALTSCIVLLIAGVTAIVRPAAAIPPSGIDPAVWKGVVAGCFAFGFLNYIMIACMGWAMRKGPNAIVWAIIQSGFIYPFFMGWLVFHETMGAWRIAGIVMIIASVALYAAGGAKSKSEDGASARQAPLRAWIVPALLGMLFCGLNQCGGNLPSYLPRGDEFPPAFRTALMAVGMLVGNLPELLKGVKPEVRQAWRRDFHEVFGWAVLVESVIYTANVLLFFPALDMMQKLGRGSMGFPTTVASCIVFFFLYGIVFLREKVSPLQAVGAVIGVAGIIASSL